MKEHTTSFFALFLMLIFVITIFIIGCENPLTPDRSKEQIELRNNDGLRNG